VVFECERNPLASVLSGFQRIRTTLASAAFEKASL